MKEVLSAGWRSTRLNLKLREVILVRHSGESAELRAAVLEEQTSTQPQSTWSNFEIQARNAIERHLGVELGSRGVDINGKIKRFDLVNEKERIVGDIKQYTTTKGGHRPSAKFSTLNEYAWLMQLLDKFSGQKWRKLFVVGEDRDMTEQYAREFDKWLDDIEIYFFSAKTSLQKIR